MNTKKMSRREKFKYLKAKGFKVNATMKNVELDKFMGMDEAPPEAKKSKSDKRKRRIPLGKHRSKLNAAAYNIPDNKVPRWVNDRGGRIRDALEGGYEFTQDPNKQGHVGEDPMQPQGMGSAVYSRVGSEDDGSPINAYLMVIDRDLYEEDQAEKQEEIKATQDSINRGEHESAHVDGKYIPR
jgi:hypothetical protein